MLQQENGGSSVLEEQHRGAKSKLECGKGSGGSDQKDNQSSESFLERRSPGLASRENETTEENDAYEETKGLDLTIFEALLIDIANFDKKTSEKSALAKKLLDGTKSSDNNDNRINNNSNGTANNNSLNGTSDLLLSCEDIKTSSLNNNINNVCSSSNNSSGGGDSPSNSSSSNNKNNPTSGNRSTTTTLNTSESQVSERSGGTGCDDLMRGMGSVTGRTMGASESRSDHRSPDDDDTSFNHPAPVIFTGRMEEIRTSMGTGENPKRKKKDTCYKTYQADSVDGHFGDKPVKEILHIIDPPEDLQNKLKERERGKGPSRVKNHVKTKENAPVSSVNSPCSDGESTSSPPATSPERTKRPLSPQSERGGSPVGLAEDCEVLWLSDPDRAKPEDWEKVRRGRRQKKTPPAPFVAPERRDHKERCAPFGQNPHHHNNNHHQQLQQQQHKQTQTSQVQQPNVPQSSTRYAAAAHSTSATAAVQTSSTSPSSAASTSKKASPPISRIANNSDDDFPPIGPPPSHGTRPLVQSQKPKTITTGPWGSGRMADVLQGKKVPPPQQQSAPQQPREQRPPTPQQQLSPKQQRLQQQQQSPPKQQQQQALNLQATTSVKSDAKSTPPVNAVNRGGSTKTIRPGIGVVPGPTGPILPPGADGDYGDELREEEGLSFGNFDVETIRSIKASARIRVASRRDEEELKSCFNYGQCVKLLNDHWLEVHRTVQDPQMIPARSIEAGGIRKQ
ncbi:putative uncharacterized protein DDB_G0291608 [Galendromus occidentalis]|uniref:Uncharacterized protein n=1 Tax=Galendromus occidentalis TaxID=34638 RepID=A0AAJ6VZ71_9ACAR|nr:putative uncharacterized protein DDB_G0291608 [Galendromus occidentalis]